MRLSCLARNGRSPGEESLTAAIAVQAIEAQPAFGQIKPMRGSVLACTEQHLGDVPASDRPTQEVLRSRRGKENLACRRVATWLSRRQKTTHNSDTPQSDDEIPPTQSKCSNGGRDYRSFKMDDPSFRRSIYANRARDDKRVQSLARGRHPRSAAA